MARGDSLARQLQLFMLLDGVRELEVDAAADRLGCARRTVYRDFEVLQRVGMPLYQVQHGRRARWRLDEGYRRRLSVTFGLGEVLGLLAGARALQSADNSVFQHAAARALDKLRATLAPEVQRRVRVLEERTTVGAGPRHDLAAKRDGIDALVDAVERAETVELSYRKLGAQRASRYTIDPYFLHQERGAIYVIGWAHERAAARTFLVDRLVSVQLTGRTFERRAGFDAKGFLQGSFGVWSGRAVRVALRFSGKAARLVAESIHHPTQINQWRADGTLDVAFTLPVSPALVAWVRGFGREVRVLAPRKLQPKSAL